MLTSIYVVINVQRTLALYISRKGVALVDAGTSSDFF